MPRVRRSRWRKRISTRSSERRMVWGVVWILGAVLLGSVLLYFSQRGIGTGAPPAESGNTTPTPDAEAIHRLPVTGADAASAYVLKQGGQKVLDGIKSVRAAGTLAVGERKYDFQMIKKAPRFVRIQLESKTGSLMLGIDSAGAWVAYRDPAGNLQVWDADDATRDWLWLMAPMGTWLAHPDDHDANFTLETPATGGNATTVLVSAVSPGGRKFTYTLGAGEFLPQRVEMENGAAGTPPVAVQLEKSQLTEGKVWLPYKLVAEANNAQPVVLEVEHLKFNTGVLNAVFDRPTPDAESANAKAPPPSAIISMGATQGGAATLSGQAGFHDSLKNTFESNPMRVHDFVAQTNEFQASAAPRIEPAPANVQPNLAAFGFPWPLPW